MSPAPSASRPLVTIVIRTYNRASTILGAITSAKSQSLENREICVVDDGSTDDTPALLAAETGIRYIRQANSGIVGSRRTGLEAAAGKYIALLDSDDRWDANYLERMVRPMEATGAGIAFCDLVRVDPEGRPHPGFASRSKRLLAYLDSPGPHTLAPAELRSLFIDSMPAPSSAMVLLREHCRCDWPFRVRVLDDWLMALEVIFAAAPCGLFVGEALVTKGMEADGVYESRTALPAFREWFYDDRTHAMKRFGDRLTAMERQVWRRELAELAFDAGHSAAVRGGTVDSLKWYGRALRWGKGSRALVAALKSPMARFGASEGPPAGH